MLKRVRRITAGGIVSLAGGGLNWLPRDTPIDVFFELAPSLELTPSTGFAIDGALGARFYF